MNTDPKPDTTPADTAKAPPKSSLFDGWKGVTIVCVALAVFGGLAALRVDVAIISAIAAAVATLAFRANGGGNAVPATALVVIAGGYFLACAPAQTKAVEAEAAYTAEQMQCVDQATTRVEADECRDRVRKKWALDAGTDAGKDGAK